MEYAFVPRVEDVLDGLIDLKGSSDPAALVHHVPILSLFAMIVDPTSGLRLPLTMPHPGSHHQQDASRSVPMAVASETGMPWTDGEIDLVVSAYFDLLAAELRGERPTKATRIREIQRLMPARTTGSIEFKMGNVSAVLDQLHQPWIDGYKPYPNYQHRLRDAVIEWRDRDRRVIELLVEYQANSLAATSPVRRSVDELLVDPPSIQRRERRKSIGLTTGPLGAIRDLQNRKLGKAGEEFVLDAERLKLERHGRSDLASRVEWTSEERGDGAGYDIDSFRPDGSPLRIEVKTTNLGIRTPFHITRWEVETSKRESEIWSLYRVFDFRSDPRLYRLDGSVEESARLEPSVFIGAPR